MNKEAIERTKARCKKEIHDKEWITVLPGFRMNKAKMQKAQIKEALAKNQQLFNQFRNPKHMPTSYYIPEINLWMPLSKKELIVVPVILCMFAVLIYWWLS